jgi:EAL domain-containing protein (putative c-di-GMP-specific phosphodiesterase class I)/GGDEF domain-containing protein
MMNAGLRVPQHDDAVGSLQVRRSQLLGLIRDAMQQARPLRRNVAVLMLCLDPKDRLRLFTLDHAENATNATTQALPRLLRSVDRFCLVGADQICVVLPDLSTTAQAFLAAHKLSREISAELEAAPGDAWARVLVGIACFPDQSEDAESLLVHADAAAAHARGSESGIGLFNEAGGAAGHEQLPILRAQLLECLQSNGFHLAYQPQLDLATGRCESAEALLRATLADGTNLPPPLLVSTAEQEGTIQSLTGKVLNGALRQSSTWASAGLKMGISVNLSAYNLRDPDFPEVVARGLESWKVSPETLTLEIVESSMIDSFAEAAASLDRLKQLGVKLSIDDFGTGYSCLAYLRQLPLDELKVDRTFVKNMLNSKQDRQLVQATIDLAHNFDLRAVGEGVEDEATVECLQQMGCDLIQGYVLSKALPGADFARWLSDFAAGRVS